MGLYERIKELCTKHETTVKQLEIDLKFPRSSIRKFDTNKPSIEKVQSIADYFNVSLDYLTGKTDEPETSQDIKELLTTKDGLYFKFAKEAEELDLSENDLQFILETYKLHKKHKEH